MGGRGLIGSALGFLLRLSVFRPIETALKVQYEASSTPNPGGRAESVILYKYMYCDLRGLLTGTTRKRQHTPNISSAGSEQARPITYRPPWVSLMGWCIANEFRLTGMQAANNLRRRKVLLFQLSDGVPMMTTV